MIVEWFQRLPADVSVEEAKIHARIDGNDEDALIQTMITTASLEFEDRAQIAIASNAIRVRFPEWPIAMKERLTLPIGPLVDPEDVEVTTDTGEFKNYRVNIGLRPTLTLTGERPAGAFQVEYDAGFEADGKQIPDDIRLALLDQVAAYYDARGASGDKALALSPHFSRIAARYRGVRA